MNSGFFPGGGWGSPRALGIPPFLGAGTDHTRGSKHKTKSPAAKEMQNKA